MYIAYTAVGKIVHLGMKQHWAGRNQVHKVSVGQLVEN